MSDKSAVPLPAPAGASEGMNLANRAIPWFDGETRKVDTHYVADSRTVALGAHEEAGAGTATVYGAWDGGIVTRASQDPPARFVAGQWLSRDGLAGTTLLADALAYYLPMLDEDASQLQVDDRAVLGLWPDPDGATSDPAHWSTPVLGELPVPGLIEALALRPATVTLGDGVLTLIEPGVDAGVGELVLELALDHAGHPDPAIHAGAPGVALRSAVALLLDEKLDGAWERPSPLWIPTSTGMLRIDQKAVESAPYRFFSESRSIDVRRWFPELGAGGAARLMLDQSGPKTLAVRRDETGVFLTLTVHSPALVLILAGMAVDGGTLLAPRQPPGAAALAQAASLQLVPVHLCGDATSPWELTSGDTIQLHWTRPDDAGITPLMHFTGHANWVLPPEAAVNGAPGVSPLRLLVPMEPEDSAQSFLLRADTEAGSGSPSMLAEPLGAFATMAGEARMFGPLASFDASADADRELWPGDGSIEVPEPAVLRAAYRVLPPGVASDGASASFAATRVRAKPSDQPDVAPFPVTDLDVAADRRWVVHPESGATVQRIEHGTAWPGARFGWTGAQFLSPKAMEKMDHRSQNAALAWGELREDAGALMATHWIRLPDESLVRGSSGAVPSMDDALAAWTQADVVFGEVALADRLVQARWGLAQLRMRMENNGSKLTLLVGPKSVEIPVEQHAVNRIVVASAHSRSVEIGMAPGVQTATLNRIYLELERRGDLLIVVRGMLGWGASAAFGWRGRSDAGAPQFHVTERFERLGGELQRSVEYNGVLSRQLTAQDGIDLYFWDTAQAPDASTLRLICHYRLRTRDGGMTSICALQDAALVGESLDLSADVAILGSADTANTTRLSDPWDPDRRKLYRLLFDTVPEIYKFAGFLRIRTADVDRVVPVGVTALDEAVIVPAWFLCDRDLIPWFDTASGLPVPERDSWTSAGLLRSGAATALPGLEITLHGVSGFTAAPYYACTLIGMQGLTSGLPIWVPSPVRIPQAGDQVVDKTVADDMLYLWLFNPGPRMIAQWPQGALPDDAERHKQALREARRRLWRMGWTREAVLQLPAAAAGGDVIWEVVDSPLLNRGASLAWFGWPLAPDAQFPFDVLPATRQVPQTRSGSQQSYALQVAFEHDALDGGVVNFVYDSGHPEIGPDAPDGLRLRAGGLRAGVYHKLVAYGARDGLVAPDRLARPAWRTGAALTNDGSRLAWCTELVDLAPAISALAGGIVLYQFVPPCTAVQFGGAPPGLQWSKDGVDWAVVKGGDVLQLDGAGTASMQLKLPAPARWSTLSVTLQQAGGALESRTHFPAGGTRWAGVFDGSGSLLAFGEEQAIYLAPENGLTLWTRVSSAVLAPRLAKMAKRVVTIDLDGQCVESA